MRPSHNRFCDVVFFCCLLAMLPAWSATTTTTASKTETVIAKPIDNRFIANVAAAGVTFLQTKDKLEIDINEKTAMAALPTLQAEHAIPRIAPGDIVRAPLSLSVDVVGVSYTVVILNAIYSSKPDTDKLTVQAYVLPAGASQKQLCYSFDFDRVQYKKMDMGKLTPKDFMMNTSTFIFSDWCKINMENEGKQKTTYH